MAFIQGKFTPNNPSKYIGNVGEIEYRSSWELEVFKMLDNNPNVICWVSEEIAIPYMKPQPDGKSYKKARYFPDIYVEYVNRNGDYIKELMEIKPKKQSRSSRSRNPKTKLMENYTFAINTAKWEAAKAWCAAKGISFKVYTEASVFGGKKPSTP